MKWFEGIDNVKDLHKMLIRLAKKYHPDIGGDDNTMKSINAEYDEMRDILSADNFAAEDMIYTYSSAFDDSVFTDENYKNACNYGETDFDDSTFTSEYYENVYNFGGVDDSDFKNTYFADWNVNFAQNKFDKSKYKVHLMKIAYCSAIEKLRRYWRSRFKKGRRKQ